MTLYVLGAYFRSADCIACATFIIRYRSIPHRCVQRFLNTCQLIQAENPLGFHLELASAAALANCDCSYIYPGSSNAMCLHELNQCFMRIAGLSLSISQPNVRIHLSIIHFDLSHHLEGCRHIAVLTTDVFDSREGHMNNLISARLDYVVLPADLAGKVSRPSGLIQKRLG